LPHPKLNNWVVLLLSLPAGDSVEIQVVTKDGIELITHQLRKFGLVFCCAVFLAPRLPVLVFLQRD
jgi:hypothetical protein